MSLKPISAKCVFHAVRRGKCTGANTKLIENETGLVEIMQRNDKNRKKVKRNLFNFSRFPIEKFEKDMIREMRI